VLLLDAWLGAVIVLKTQVLREGSWTRKTRWVQVALVGLGVFVLVSTLLSSQFGFVDAHFLASAGLSASGPEARLLSSISRGLPLVLVCVTLILLGKIGAGLRRLYQGPENRDSAF
jgi:hypothetical protein